MLHHRTTDAQKRAEHIADREERLREKRAVERFWSVFDSNDGSFGPCPYSDWPRYWLDVYGDSVRELQSEEPL